MTAKAPFRLRGHNPDVLACIANLSNDEVFTPPVLANQMLDTLRVVVDGTVLGGARRGRPGVSMPSVAIVNSAMASRVSRLRASPEA